ncbi:nucleotide sugar dehydrogenase [Paracoccaceae bacterium]|nr:nucleotide sugar dehydrogenase [Paracoccaceae bacterium]
MHLAQITVVGSGYVGMSLSVLLAQKNKVTVLDIDQRRVDLINSNLSTIQDKEIDRFFSEKDLSLFATTDKNLAYQNSEFVIVATPTDYDERKNSFDTSAVDSVVRDALALNARALVVIKSTIPVGHTRLLQEKFSTNRVIFSPEFLREGRALKDNLQPTRIIVGSEHETSEEFAVLLRESADKKHIDTLMIGSTEAEAVKLFANTYLAMRVSFFNELDSYSLNYDLDTESIINGVCLDDRIGNGYNNPSFGYGGYCLPKDTKQLLANYNETPQSLVGSIVSSNEVRKDFITQKIITLKPKVVGIFRLVMKEGSDNFRSSAIQGIMERLCEHGVEIIVYEPSIYIDSFRGAKVIKNLEHFKSISDVVISNRNSDELWDIQDKVFTRDIFKNN